MAALSCGMIAVGSCNGEVTSTILQTLMEKSEADLKDTYGRFLALGLGLCYLGKIGLILCMLFNEYFCVGTILMLHGHLTNMQ